MFVNGAENITVEEDCQDESENGKGDAEGNQTVRRYAPANKSLQGFLMERRSSRTRRSENFRGNGGAEGNRTPDLHVANVALSQLSYGPDDLGAPTGAGTGRIMCLKRPSVKTQPMLPLAAGDGGG